MLGATFSIVAWMGWTVPPDRGEAGSVASPAPPPSSVKARLDVNQATVEELNELPGIGPALAQRIIDHRRSHGPFVAIDDLLLVKGIGTKKLHRLRELVDIGNSDSKRERRQL
jgi:competence protein ComEA